MKALSLSRSGNTKPKRESVRIPRTEEFFRKLYQQVATGIAVTDWQGVFQQCNPAYSALLGYTEKELRTINFASLIHPEDRETNLALVHRLQAGEISSFDIENRYIRKNGEPVWVHKHVFALHGKKGEPTHLIALVTNISERKKAEKARSLHSAIVESSEDAIISKDLDGIIQSWNAAAWHIFGYTEAEAIGRPITILIPHELQDEEHEILERMKAGQRIRQYETVRITKDGKRIDISLTISPIKDPFGSVVGISKIARDISERKRAEESLRQSEERLRLAQKVADIGVFEWNIKTDADTWSPEVERMYGLPPGGFGKSRGAFEKLVYPDDRTEVSRLIDHSLKTGEPTDGEWRVVWPDGSVHWIAGRCQVFMAKSGEAVRMIGVNMDITKRKQAEQALSGMTRKLVEAQEQERTRIARELHDDITQRLALLALEIEEVQDRSEMPSDVRSRTSELSRRAREIATDVQVLSHELHSSKLEYLGLVAGTKGWCNEFGERHGMEIEFQSSGSPNSLPREVSLCLFRVLQEALQNAAKYSGAKRVEVQLREQSGETQLIVSDSGKGFDVAAAMQDRGLGLTSMQERVRLAHGTISIDSKPMAGTTIHVRVPFGAQSQAQRAGG